MKVKDQKIEEKSHKKCIEAVIDLQQCDQDNKRELSLVEYVMWKSDTKSIAWVSSITESYSGSSLVSSYSS